MKGLLLKDALMLFRQSRLLVALMLALALFSGTEPWCCAAFRCCTRRCADQRARV
ncbi:MAG: hypothetical protein ACLUFV_05155 [Acutalibacteraceae bacterium]